MRKYLLHLAVCLFAAFPAFSATALFTDSTETKVREGVTCTAGKLTGEHGVLYSRLPIYNVSHFRKANAATAAVAVTIDLSAASRVTEPTRLLTFESNHELGLMATPGGISGNWHGKPWGEVIPYGKLATHPAAFTRSGSAYITLTVVASGCRGAGWNGVGGIIGYDVNGTVAVNYPLLASAENRDFRAITANTELVKSISVTPDVNRNPAVIATAAGEQAAKIQRKYLKSCGEWLSPTQWMFIIIGTLVLIATLSIGCFRKGKW